MSDHAPRRVTIHRFETTNRHHRTFMHMTHEFSAKHFIVLSGEAGAGKDSVADTLRDRHGYVKIALSDAMKRFVGTVFGFTEEQLFGPSHARNEPDPRWARPCVNCDSTGLTRPVDPEVPQSGRVCPTCDGTGRLNDNSPRRILQLLGDEWGRQMIHPDIWTLTNRQRLTELLDNDVKIVVVDARFDNDRQNLARWFGAKVVDVQTNRPRSNPGASWRQHGSELSRPETGDVDYVVHNDEKWPFPNLSDTVSRMLLELYDEA